MNEAAIKCDKCRKLMGSVKLLKISQPEVLKALVDAGVFTCPACAKILDQKELESLDDIMILNAEDARELARAEREAMGSTHADGSD